MEGTISPIDPRVILLQESVINAPVVWKGEYAYFIHPLSDGVPKQSAELLGVARDLISEKVNWDEIDLILGLEAMGIPLAAALCLDSGKPLVIGRKREYGLPGEVAIDQTTGYSKGEIFLNDISEGDRILVVDDVVSTGGTMLPVLKTLESIGAIVQDCWIVFEKGDGVSKVREEGNWPLNSLIKMKMEGEKITILD
ncbi:MAG TPA: adenine phosphoribosyltransferase [Candidatus Poseidoniales archaeon]|jgi:adenine phosphoribosyltransferase|nr:MAG: adenine phosphoribosyltransferase [Euryarchaeota archaeon]HIG03564.1 adenine phosphoribosyltransferase [Candidatus Poseidoniales archaeon]HIK78021.1 adenine phosphoribosyltransferase [Candidatus Poseidoniales archaeon]